MEIQQIKSGVIAAFLGREELSRRGLLEGRFDRKSADDIAHEAFRELGTSCSDCDVDVYINGSGLLLFAAQRELARRAICFDTLEELLAYIRELGPKAESRLVLYLGKYCMICEHLPDNAAEYGEIIDCTEEVERAATLIERRAAEQLTTCFKL